MPSKKRIKVLRLVAQVKRLNEMNVMKVVTYNPIALPVQPKLIRV